MWNVSNNKELLNELFNNNNEEMYLVDLDIINEMNELDWKILSNRQ